MCWDLNYATYTGKSNLENIIFMYNSSSSCLFVTHIIHWLRAWLNNWIMCMLHIITPCSYCKFKKAKLGTVKLSVFVNLNKSWSEYLKILMDHGCIQSYSLQRETQGRVWGKLFTATFSVALFWFPVMSHGSKCLSYENLICK